jgi:hypothetical protein
VPIMFNSLYATRAYHPRKFASYVIGTTGLIAGRMTKKLKKSPEQVLTGGCDRLSRLKLQSVSTSA